MRALKPASAQTKALIGAFPICLMPGAERRRAAEISAHPTPALPKSSLRVVGKTLARLASTCGIFPFLFRRQPETIPSLIDRYRPFYIIEIIRISRVFFILVNMVIRPQALLRTPLITVIDTVIPADRFYRQAIAFECGGITSHYFRPLFLGYFISTDIKAPPLTNTKLSGAFCKQELINPIAIKANRFLNMVKRPAMPSRL
jgi:hypothetical protein